MNKKMIYNIFFNLIIHIGVPKLRVRARIRIFVPKSLTIRENWLKEGRMNINTKLALRKLTKLYEGK